jgi:hypothetical protein
MLQIFIERCNAFFDFYITVQGTDVEHPLSSCGSSTMRTKTLLKEGLSYPWNKIISPFGDPFMCKEERELHSWYAKYLYDELVPFLTVKVIAFYIMGFLFPHACVDNTEQEIGNWVKG